jgi:hypothetical protein
MVAHTCNPSTWEAEAGGSKFRASPSYILRPCLKNKTNKIKYLPNYLLGL